MGHQLPIEQARKVIVITRQVTLTQYVDANQYREGNSQYQMTDDEIKQYEEGMDLPDSISALIEGTEFAKARCIKSHASVDVMFLRDDALRQLRGE